MNGGAITVGRGNGGKRCCNGIDVILLVQAGDRTVSKPMTTFLTTAQREFLLSEYKEQLEEFDQLEEYGFLLEDMKTWDNVSFFREMTEQMPIYAEPGMLAKMMAK